MPDKKSFISIFTLSHDMPAMDLSIGMAKGMNRRSKQKNSVSKFVKCYNHAHMKKLLAVVSMLAVMGGGCAAQTPSTTTPPAEGGTATQGKMSMAQFMTGSWKIKSMQMVGGQTQDVSSLGLTLSFDGAKMTGKVCNSMSGSYTVEDNLVKFGPVAQTKMFCEGLPGQVETAVTTGFKNNLTISKQGENLVLIGGAVLVLERQGASGTE